KMPTIPRQKTKLNKNKRSQDEMNKEEKLSKDETNIEKQMK
ncbi:43137_t:CDS:1, partial [Gigaspora margarita]